MIVLFLLTLLHSDPVDPSVAYSQLQLHTKPGHVDMWTMSEKGCTCQGHAAYTCPCCAPGGCPCSQLGAQRCVQCGMEAACSNVCNMTISSASIRSQSGFNYGEIKSSPGVRGPVTCYFRFLPQSGERVELHVYRLLRIGHYYPQNNRCKGGGLEFLSSVSSRYPMLCGENGRYSPPVVMFGDDGEPGQVLITVEDITPRTQWLLHYSFTDVDHSSLGIRMTGGVKNQGGSDCDYSYRDCGKETCFISSPGYPGIYPQDTKCHHRLEHNHVQIQISVNLPGERQSCKSNYVKLFNSSNSDRQGKGHGRGQKSNLVKKICGSEDNLEIVINSNEGVLLEFSSGPVRPPFVYNGFIAEIKFVANPESNSEDDSASRLDTAAKLDFQDTEPFYTTQDYKFPKVEPRHLLVQQEDTILKYNADNVIETITRPTKILGRHRKLPDWPDVKTFKCHQEVTEPDRSGFIQSTRLTYTNGTCSLVFRGEHRDVVSISMDTLLLSGPNCSSHLRLSIQDPSQPRGLRIVKKFCSPLSHKSYDQQPHYPLIIEANLVFLDFYTINQTHDMFSGAFAFQNKLLEGEPVKNTFCDSKVSGDFVPWLPKLQGTITRPSVSPLLWPHLGPLQCTTHLQSGDNQSVLLTIHDSYLATITNSMCMTVCDGLGCVCSHPVGADTLNIIITKIQDPIISHRNDSRHCFCGDFQKYLPVTLSSRDSLQIVYNSPNYNFQEANNLLKISAKYEFLKTTKLSCGKQLFNTSSGSINQPGNEADQLRLEQGQYIHEECEWIISPPPHTSLSLLVDTSSIKNVSCGGWQMRIWTVDKQSGDRESVDRMCSEDNRREYTIPHVYSRIIHVAVSSVYTHVLNYSVTWQASGPLVPDSLQFQKTELRSQSSGDDGLQVAGIGGMGGLDIASDGHLDHAVHVVLMVVMAIGFL